MEQRLRIMCTAIPDRQLITFMIETSQLYSVLEQVDIWLWTVMKIGSISDKAAGHMGKFSPSEQKNDVP